MKPCKVCGAEVTSKRSRTRVCSEVCRRAAISKAVSARFTNETGKRFGAWTVLSHTQAARCVCRCDCGYEAMVDSSSLRTGGSTSCLACAKAARRALVTEEVREARRVAASRAASEKHEKSDGAIARRAAYRRSDAGKSAQARFQTSNKPREWRRKSFQAKRDAVNAIKATPCLDCGGAFPPVCMDFDHRPGEGKTAQISQLVRTGVSLERVLEEISKCDLVCANCHRIRTYGRSSEVARACLPAPKTPPDRRNQEEIGSMFAVVSARHMPS